MRKQSARPQRNSILFLLPSLLGVGVFILIPFGDVVRRSFTRAIGSDFVGLENYRMVITNEAFRIAITNTGRLLVIALPLLLVLSLGVALMLYRVVEKAGIFKTAFLIPMAIPVASVVLLWRVLFEPKGLLNGLLVQWGRAPIRWMDSSMAFWVLMFSFLWKNIGYNVVLWMAGLADISPSLYEAARVDGAGSLRSFWYITLPGLLPCLFTVLVLSLVNFFKVFREAWLVAGDYPHSSMYLLQHLFNNWFRELSIDKLAAAAVLVAGISFVGIALLRKVWDTSDF